MVTVGNGPACEESAGPIWVYHSLPYLTPAQHDRMVRLVWSGGGLPIPTKSAIWVMTRPRVAFTNHYHRDGGLTTDPDL